MAKKSLIVKPRIYEKVDEAFHGLFFNRGIVFDDSGLEIVVEESIPEPTKSTIKVIQPSLFSQASCQPVSTSNYAHTFKTRARYDTVDSNGKKLRKSTAFQSIEDQISWEQAQPLVDDYREKIANDLGNNNYKCTVEKGVVIIRSAVTKKEIKAVINEFSSKSRIPIISGLFKAAVGGMVITSVISDLVGSRFIITKVTPEFLTQQIGPKK